MGLAPTGKAAPFHGARQKRSFNRLKHCLGARNPSAMTMSRIEKYRLHRYMITAYRATSHSAKEK